MTKRITAERLIFFLSTLQCKESFGKPPNNCMTFLLLCTSLYCHIQISVQEKSSFILTKTWKYGWKGDGKNLCHYIHDTKHITDSQNCCLSWFHSWKHSSIFVQSWVLRSCSLEKSWTLQGNRGLPILKSKHRLIQCLMLLIWLI